MLVIVADDLTGALDTAAPFAARGLHTEVVLRANDLAKGVALFPDVLSINLASRDGSSEDAFDWMQELVGRLPSNTRMFKKVDSRLKGHIASELDAVSFGRALVAPAIPTFGRVVRNGNVEGFGVAQPLSVASALKHHAHRATIPDTVTENELDAALQRAEEIDVDLLVGARGLAEALARKMTKVSRGRQVSPPGGRGLFVIGSRDGITLDQVKELRQCDGVAYHPAPNGALPEGPITPASLLPGAGNRGGVRLIVRGGIEKPCAQCTSPFNERGVHPASVRRGNGRSGSCRDGRDTLPARRRVYARSWPGICQRPMYNFEIWWLWRA